MNWVWHSSLDDAGLGWALSKFLTMCGRRMLARLWMRAWLNPESSRNRASFCSSMILFSSSMFFRFFSMVEICGARSTAGSPTLTSGTHQHPSPLGLNSWPRIQTWDWSFTMAASISELDSFSSLISLFSCLISSSFSRTAGGKIMGSQQMLLGKAKVLGFLLNPSCCTVAFTSLKHDVSLTCLFLPIIFIINIFIITGQWYLNRSICKCKSKGQQSSWSPTHAHTQQGWLSWTVRSLCPILSLEWCHLKKLMHILMRNYEVHKIKQYF